jgi:hypothetical protein
MVPEEKPAAFADIWALPASSRAAEARRRSRSMMNGTPWMSRTTGGEILLAVTGSCQIETIYKRFNLAKLSGEFLTGITTRPRYLNFADPKNDEVAQID